MSNLIKNQIAMQRAKRINRINEAQKQSKEPDFATYEGKSLIDGTDIVRVGANEPVTGFKVISNAPLSIGDKVSLRPSAIGGLQSVDARNLPIEEPETPVEQLLSNLIVVPIVGFNLGLIEGVATFFEYIDLSFSSPTKKIAFGFNKSFSLSPFDGFAFSASTSSNISESEASLSKSGSLITIGSSKSGDSRTLNFNIQIVATDQTQNPFGSKGVRARILVNNQPYKVETLWTIPVSNPVAQIIFNQEISSSSATLSASFSLI